MLINSYNPNNSRVSFGFGKAKLVQDITLKNLPKKLPAEAQLALWRAIWLPEKGINALSTDVCTIVKHKSKVASAFPVPGVGSSDSIVFKISDPKKPILKRIGDFLKRKKGVTVTGEEIPVKSSAALPFHLKFKETNYLPSNEDAQIDLIVNNFKALKEEFLKKKQIQKALKV